VTIPIEIGLPARLAALAEKEPSGAKELFEREFRSRLGELGLAGAPEVLFRSCERRRVVQVRVDGVPLFFPSRLLRGVWTAVAPPGRGELSDVDMDGPPDGYPYEWLRDFLEGLDPGQGPDAELAVRFVVHLAMETIFEHPECLAGRADAPAFLEGSQDSEVMRRVVAGLLHLGRRVAAHETVTERLRAESRYHRTVPDLVEVIAATLGAVGVEVLLSPEGHDLFAGDGAAELEADHRRSAHGCSPRRASLFRPWRSVSSRRSRLACLG
jgi:hypothetical protein